MASQSTAEETQAGAGTVAAGAGAEAGHSAVGAEATSDVSQAEVIIAHNLAVVGQREFERQATNAETLAHAKNVNALELQGLMDNQRLAR